MDQKSGGIDGQSCGQGDVNRVGSSILNVVAVMAAVAAKKTLSGMLMDQSRRLLTRVAGGEGGKRHGERLLVSTEAVSD
ncbi:hypothetical protein IscW_ISCW009291 [Ixodes scapularis]|uniref:Uncharacterized protein n=1 Tax=Ixodes scapularis TaxID=6945 RepID=B7Q252_IXOSC|nr:hypothetical protein IscW_ISCW009291 [Ixodes scapularis]|eukprot:XP_002410469.1 hypothetical protein IscW_ISCW009291 [Ixodes scapularis]